MNSATDFWQNIDPLDRCLVWTGNVGADGYGRLRWAGKMVKAHRLAFFLMEGHWPEPVARHRCPRRDTLCVLHVIEGSYSDNSMDAVQDGTHRQTRKTHCDHGHEFTEANTYLREHPRARMCRTCNRDRKRVARAAAA